MRILFFGNVVDALEGTSTGGAELQIALLAKSLALKGYDVVVADPTAKEDLNTNEGLRILRVQGWGDGIRGMRFFTHKLPSLIKLLRQQSADVHYVRGFNFWYIVVLLFTYFNKSTFVLATAHDSDILSFRTRYKLFYSHNNQLWEWMSNYIPSELFAPVIFKFASIILVQHEAQRQLVKKRGREAFVFRNIIEVQSTGERLPGENKNFVFVGALHVRKGLTEMLKAVTECPGATFEIVGPPTDFVGQKTFEALQKLHNTVMRGRLSHEETIQVIARARALINTSPMEGFPNTFLEAWSVGTPVLSLTVDPDGIIESNKLGFVCKGSLEELKKRITAFENIFSPEAMRTYIQKNHSIETAAERFASIIAKSKGL